MAGSEHDAVFQQVVQPWCREQKLTCTMTELGSVDQARLLDGGDAPYDGFCLRWESLGARDLAGPIRITSTDRSPRTPDSPCCHWS
ncbi:hypothetical protein [Nocardia asiatica]|uniref:hypothetical protein n=1 Tax=Nocardia asiatica TaxID=209252 RepID=UPI0012FCD124|nr:hypothetical protein [Nocardia asiatica]